MQGDFFVGDRLVQPKINSIQYEGKTIRLEPKVMQVLLVLASNPGEVFTREEIHDVVWRDVFVGDDVLMRAVSEIRRIFSDDPKMSHTVQTVPKVGYRMIAPVRQLPSSQAVGVAVDTMEKQEIGPAISPVGVPIGISVPKPSVRAAPLHFATKLALAGAGAAILILVLAALGYLYLRRRSTQPVAADYISHPLTTYPGSQVQPALSPEGDVVAFIWSKRPDDLGHLYVKSLRSGAPVRLTTGAGQDFSPAWSPDGHSIAFIRRSGGESAVEVVGVVGGSERRIYTLPGDLVFQYGGLTWTRDGNHLIFPQQTHAGGASQLVEVSLATHNIVVLTTPPENWSGDLMPALSPDGSTLAFVRGTEQSTRDIYLMRLPDGTPRELTSDANLVLGLAWTTDGSKVVFASNREGSIALWRVGRDGGAPERDVAGSDGAYWPTIAGKAGLLAYTHGNASWSIVSIPLDVSKEPAETEVLTSSEQDASPQVSPAGDRLAFQSWRSGGQEIWTSEINGLNPIQLTTQGASAGSPSWSHDGRLIAFDARSQGFPHIYIIGADGGEARPITNGSYSDIVPSWSLDSHWLFFGSNRSGEWQIWRVAAEGHSPAEQVTQDGGIVAKQSSDGKWIYYTKSAAPGVWRRPVAGGAEEQVCDGPAQGDQNYWTLSDKNLYVLSRRTAGRVFLRVNLNTGNAIQIYTLKHDVTPFTGLTVTPDGAQLIFAELMEAHSNITLVEHYR